MRVLITSALPYINGIKHLGNLIGSMLPADCYARFMRNRGHEVLYICATDEHGTPAELAAQEKGQGVAEYCGEMHLVQKDLGEQFEMSWDYFGRSSSQQNKELTQHFHDCLTKNDLIEERITKQVYSVDDKRFLPDRYVQGTCPHCGYEKARGDQCESCTRVLEPTDLINPYSSVSGGKNIEIRDSKHLFLRQSVMVDKLRTWIDEKDRQGWPLLVTSIARKWLDEGLEDRGITRDLVWGVPVNKEGFDGKVFYVWFDAPIAYIAATKEWADSGKGQNWQSWWREDLGASDVKYVQFMAKDNIPFHTVSFPVTLFGSGEDWKVVDYIKGFNWLTYYGGKFSTSQKRGVFMDQALDILPADIWRWFLLSNAPEGADTSFTWEGLQTSVNKDLADVLGNFINRITRFCDSKFGAVIPEGGQKTQLEIDYEGQIFEKIKIYFDLMEQMEFRKSAAELRSIWVLGNEYLQQAAPWTVYKTDAVQAAMCVRFALNLVVIFAGLAQPFIPEISKKILSHFSEGEQIAKQLWLAEKDNIFDGLKAGQAFSVPDILVAKIDDDLIAEWKNRFGGEDL